MTIGDPVGLRRTLLDHQRVAQARDVQHAQQEVADVDQHQAAVRHRRLAAEDDQRAQSLRVAERHVGQVEQDARRYAAAGQQFADGRGELAGRGHVDLPGQRQDGFGVAALDRDGKIRTFHPVSVSRRPLRVSERGAAVRIAKP